MLKTACLNPEINAVLSKCGHGDKVLIADGNYPIHSKSGNAAVVNLNLTHGIPLVTDVLRVLNAVAPIERMEVMIPESGEEPPIYREFRDLLGPEVAMDTLDRLEFYDVCGRSDVKLAIATGEQRIYANILLTVGVVASANN